jgi:predicted lipoprotein
MRQIDFAPTRPALIERAIKSQPRGAQALERIGTPAKGLPALEWLLWTQPAQPSTPACDYAIEVARDLGREVQAVQAGFVAQATAVSVEEPEPELLRQGFEQFVNQWLGGLNRLRWAQIDKPRQAARSAGEATPDSPRAASGSTMAAWSSQWQALHQLAVLDTRDAPAPGTAAVPIETLLRSRGLNPLADRWRDAVQVADGVMTRVRLDDAPSLDDATRALGVVQERLEGEVAPALEVGIGFSDADGD